MRCFACIKPIRADNYCTKCKKELFGGVSIKELDIDQSSFYAYHQEQATRISISGVQDKISLVQDGDKLIPASKNGRFILKPVPPTRLKNLEDIVANEHLNMQLSRQIFKIPTALCAIVHLKGGEMAYLVKRFDYRADGTKLDQEDFASLLDTTEESGGTNYKYDSSYEKVAKKIKEIIPASVPNLEDFYKRVLFNHLIGNGDAHLKNISVYRPENRADYMLTPNYDLLFTKMHINEVFGEMALELFDDYESRSREILGFYSLEDFEVFAEKIGIPKRRVLKIFEEFFASILASKELIASSFLTQEGKKHYLEFFKNRALMAFCYTLDSKEYSYKSELSDLADQHVEAIKKI